MFLYKCLWLIISLLLKYFRLFRLVTFNWLFFLLFFYLFTCSKGNNTTSSCSNFFCFIQFLKHSKIILRNLIFHKLLRHSHPHSHWHKIHWHSHHRRHSHHRIHLHLHHIIHIYHWLLWNKLLLFLLFRSIWSKCISIGI